MTRITKQQIPLVKSAILTKRQDSKCPLCSIGLTVASGCLDHDHSSGLIRGVLCRNCNGIEGKVRNLVTRARRGMPHTDYLGQLLRYWITHSKDQTGLYHPIHLTDDEKRIKRSVKAKKARAKRKVTT